MSHILPRVHYLTLFIADDNIVLVNQRASPVSDHQDQIGARICRHASSPQNHHRAHGHDSINSENKLRSGRYSVYTRGNAGTVYGGEKIQREHGTAEG